MSPDTTDTNWFIFKGDRVPHPDAVPDKLPEPPRWRDFGKQHSENPAERMTKKQRRGATFHTSVDELKMVNAALYLRRPLLVTGKPGTGKTSLAYAVAYELDLGEVLYWPITTRSTLKEGLYSYDAIGRIQDFQLRGQKEDRIGKYIRLGPLGTAFLKSDKPRVLLIDEIDKSDIDLPNDLLHIFEDGEFSIPELTRIADEQKHIEVQTAYQDEMEAAYEPTVTIENGRVRCQQFPFVVLTSNGEREFPPAFLRRCLRLDIAQPDPTQLQRIVQTQLDETLAEEAADLIREFYKRRESGAGDLATDQLLNAVYLITKEQVSQELLLNQLLRPLDK